MSDHKDIKEVKSEWTDVEGTDGYGTHEQTKSKAENKAELGNEKKQEGEELHPEALIHGRRAESREATKSSPLDGRAEAQFAADVNLFGNGESTISHLEKPGWKDPK